MADETKVVINACYGGFGLSDEAKREYLTRTGQDWYEEAEHVLDSGYTLRGPFFYVRRPGEEDDLFSASDVERTDPILIALIEEWGPERVGGKFSALEVQTITKGTLYRIDEYDGYEGIETRDTIDWSVA
jgi:hypothetical protein